MRKFKYGTTGIVAMVCLCTALALGQPPPTTQPAGPDTPGQPPATQPAPDSAAVLVNGVPIMESDIDALLLPRLRIQGANESLLPQMRSAFHDRAVETLIDQRLMGEKVRQAGIEISDEEFAKIMDEDLDRYLASQSLTREDYEQRLRAMTGMSLQDQITRRAADPSVRAGCLHAKLIEKMFPEKLRVSDDEIKKYYEENLERVFKKPAEVRASHILLGKAGMTDEEKTVARKEAEGILLKVKSPGADFAALAKQYSTCPSKEKGGDVGFFAREGAMAGPFADAAFALEPGKISDVVESPFGFHIIKVTERKEASLTSMDQAKEGIRTQLKYDKTQDEITRYATELREAAKIEYPPGKEPKKPAAPPAISPTQPAPEAAPPSTQPAPKTQ